MKFPDIDHLISDHEAFSSFVYTPREEALEELNRRRADAKLDVIIHNILHGDVPAPLVKNPHAILFRQLATPNHEMLRFLDISAPLKPLTPLFWEYYSDKFTTYNDYKYALGKLKFFYGKGKKGGVKIDRMNIIDFNRYNGKKISEVKTLWGQGLIDFHHELFQKADKQFTDDMFYDASTWFQNHGKLASSYYIPFVALLIKHAILFESFLTSEKEASFTKEVFLPAFIEVYKQTGLKPLIIALEPTALEEDEFWICYPPSSRQYLDDALAAKVI